MKPIQQKPPDAVFVQEMPNGQQVTVLFAGKRAQVRLVNFLKAWPR